MTHFPFAVAKPPTESLDFLLQDRLPAPVPAPPAGAPGRLPTRPTFDDGDTLELDPPIIWHGPVLQGPAAPTLAPPSASSAADILPTA